MTTSLKWFCTVLLLSACGVRAENEDKAVLFNTFYLDGEKATYVLTIRPDKTFDLYGPDNEHISGTIRASGEHVTFTAGEVKRMFHFDSTGKDLKLGRRDGDIPVKGNVLGEMPPFKDGVFRTLYVNENNWRKKGRPVFDAASHSVEKRDPVEPVSTKPPPVAHVDAPPEVHVEPPATVEPAPVAPVAPTTPVAADITPIGNFEDLVGTYTVKNADGKTDTLAINDEGIFTFTRADGMKQSGALMRADPDLSFMTATGKRHFHLEMVASGIELTRRDADVVKPGEVLGSMPPQDRAALTWIKKDNVAPPVKAAPVPAPAPVVKTDEVKPVKVDAPAPAAGGAAVTDLKQIAGTFVHRPSPFISETLTVKEDGTFTYKDSNGASVSGTSKVDGGKVTLTSGEVVRTFTATIDDKNLSLTRTDADNPKFKNDLASMSPTVLKAAKYERK